MDELQRCALTPLSSLLAAPGDEAAPGADDIGKRGLGCHSPIGHGRLPPPYQQCSVAGPCWVPAAPKPTGPRRTLRGPRLVTLPSMVVPMPPGGWCSSTR